MLDELGRRQFSKDRSGFSKFSRVLLYDAIYDSKKFRDDLADTLKLKDKVVEMKGRGDGNAHVAVTAVRTDGSMSLFCAFANHISYGN